VLALPNGTAVGGQNISVEHARMLGAEALQLMFVSMH
jgi:hypothetical protein